MTRIKILGLALVAVFAMSALAAASASAEPNWLECKKEAGGKFEKGCGKEGGKGGYVIAVGVGKGKGFKSKGGKAVLHSVNPEANVDIPVECESAKGGGLAVAPNLVLKVKATFSKCKALGAECHNIKKETIETKTLAGSLGWINKAGKVAGTDLVLESSPGGIIAEFTCNSLGEIRTQGSVIGQNTEDVGVFSKTSKLVFAPGPYIGPQEAACPSAKEKEEIEKGEKTLAEAKKCKWTPIVNVPKFEGGPVDLLLTEVKGAITGHPGEFYPPGGIPSGQEGVAENKGENLEIG